MVNFIWCIFYYNLIKSEIGFRCGEFEYLWGGNGECFEGFNKRVNMENVLNYK